MSRKHAKLPVSETQVYLNPVMLMKPSPGRGHAEHVAQLRTAQGGSTTRTSQADGLAYACSAEGVLPPRAVVVLTKWRSGLHSCRIRQKVGPMVQTLQRFGFRTLSLFRAACLYACQGSGPRVPPFLLHLWQQKHPDLPAWTHPDCPIPPHVSHRSWCSGPGLVRARLSLFSHPPGRTFPQGALSSELRLLGKGTLRFLGWGFKGRSGFGLCMGSPHSERPLDPRKCQALDLWISNSKHGHEITDESLYAARQLLAKWITCNGPGQAWRDGRKRGLSQPQKPPPNRTGSGPPAKKKGTQSPTPEGLPEVKTLPGGDTQDSDTFQTTQPTQANLDTWKCIWNLAANPWSQTDTFPGNMWVCGSKLVCKFAENKRLLTT